MLVRDPLAVTRRRPGRRYWSSRSVRVTVVGSVVAVVLGGCGHDIRCGDPAVLDAFRRTLDQMYAEMRQYADVAVDVRDVVAVDQSPRRALCRAVMRVNVDFFGTKKHEDTTVAFQAEATEKGDVVVTVTPPNNGGR